MFPFRRPDMHDFSQSVSPIPLRREGVLRDVTQQCVNVKAPGTFIRHGTLVTFTPEDVSNKHWHCLVVNTNIHRRLSLSIAHMHETLSLRIANIHEPSNTHYCKHTWNIASVEHKHKYTIAIGIPNRHGMRGSHDKYTLVGATWEIEPSVIAVITSTSES